MKKEYISKLIKSIYKQIDKVYENEGIDEDIREILILLNKKKDFNEELIHKKINLSVIHQKKTLEDIIKIIDFEFEMYYKKLENININHRLYESNNSINDEKKPKVDERIQTSWRKLTQDWLIKHEDKESLFQYVSEHIIEISFKLLNEDYSNFKKQLKSLMMHNPNEVKNHTFKISNQANQELERIEPIIWRDESSFINESDRTLINSLNQTRDNSRINNNNLNINPFNFQINNNNNHNLNNNIHNLINNFINNDINHNNNNNINNNNNDNNNNNRNNNDNNHNNRYNNINDNNNNNRYNNINNNNKKLIGKIK